MKAFTKVFQLGHRVIRELFDDDVEVTEKIDGSQIGFGKLEDKLIVRSRNVIFNVEKGEIDGMFNEGVQEIVKREYLIPDGYMFWGEYLKSPRHVTLKYSQIPKGHIALFGMDVDNPDFEYSHKILTQWSYNFEFDVVPLLYYGKVDSPEFFKSFLDRESFLGGTKIEGVVVKNWFKSNTVGPQYVYPLAGKFVSENFREVQKNNPDFKNPKNKWEEYCAMYATEARWIKAVQHLKELGTYEGDPRDIRALIRTVHEDIIEECQDDIKDALWKFFSKDLKRVATKGLPEWYKQQLMEEQFNANNNI